MKARRYKVYHTSGRAAQPWCGDDLCMLATLYRVAPSDGDDAHGSRSLWRNHDTHDRGMREVIRTIMARTKLCRLGLIVLVLACVAEARQNSTAAQPKACSEPEQKQLDFWVGEGELTWPGNHCVCSESARQSSTSYCR